jgi:hypothetical protein
VRALPNAQSGSSVRPAAARDAQFALPRRALVTRGRVVPLVRLGACDWNDASTERHAANAHRAAGVADRPPR